MANKVIYIHELTIGKRTFVYPLTQICLDFLAVLAFTQRSMSVNDIAEYVSFTGRFPRRLMRHELVVDITANAARSKRERGIYRLSETGKLVAAKTEKLASDTTKAAIRRQLRQELAPHVGHGIAPPAQRKPLALAS